MEGFVRENFSTESDVEQKFLWRILTTSTPNGLGYLDEEVNTKPTIRMKAIGKGSSRKSYIPDYLVVLNGIPVLVVEAKAPGENLAEAAREGRLYATELNSSFPSAINPVKWVLVSDGLRSLLLPWDSDTTKVETTLEEIQTRSGTTEKLFKYIQRASLQTTAEATLSKIVARPFKKPIQCLGGSAYAGQELQPNSFGQALSLEFSGIFNPITRVDRGRIAKEAYVTSPRRQRFVDPIEKAINAAVHPAVVSSTLISSDEHAPLLDAIEPGENNAENEMVLLIGGVGSGKTTFVDHLREVRLAADTMSRTDWVHLNFNDAPLERELAHDWILTQVTRQLSALYPSIDPDALEVLRQIHWQEVAALEKGPLSLFPKESMEYKIRFADRLLELQRDKLATCRGIVELLCRSKGRVLITVFDNSDKRDRDDQLLIFQLANWFKSHVNTVIFLPLRDSTYDNHRNEPPLDTVLMRRVFRIDPPRFSEVLTRRIQLALNDITSQAGRRRELIFTLPNGFKVTHKMEDLASYLKSILKSVFDHSRYVRATTMGLAGRDVRKAMSIFLEFCASGHIGEHEIYMMKQANGDYTIPFDVVKRVLLRRSRRFYSDADSFIKNLFATDHLSSRPTYGLRFAVLRWFKEHSNSKSSSGLKGYHQASSLIAALVPLGFATSEILETIDFLLTEQLIHAEHLRLQLQSTEDLLSLAPAGIVHLNFTSQVDYLAAVAEDTWLNDLELSQKIADRLNPMHRQYRYDNALRTAGEFLNFIDTRQTEAGFSTMEFLSTPTENLASVQNEKRTIENLIASHTVKDQWFGLDALYASGTEHIGTVKSHNGRIGIFVRFAERRVDGLIPRSVLLEDGWDENDWPKPGTEVLFTVISIDCAQGRAALRLQRL